jgi:hypothetical protein
VFGKQVNLGVGAYELPPLKAVQIAHHGNDPDAPARVVLEADGDPDMVFRLVDWQPPEDAA